MLSPSAKDKAEALNVISWTGTLAAATLIEQSAYALGFAVDVALIVQLPGPSAVIVPSTTVATDSFNEDQFTVVIVVVSGTKLSTDIAFISPTVIFKLLLDNVKAVGAKFTIS